MSLFAGTMPNPITAIFKALINILGSFFSFSGREEYKAATTRRTIILRIGKFTFSLPRWKSFQEKKVEKNIKELIRYMEDIASHFKNSENALFNLERLSGLDYKALSGYFKQDKTIIASLIRKLSELLESMEGMQKYISGHAHEKDFSIIEDSAFKEVLLELEGFHRFFTGFIDALKAAHLEEIKAAATYVVNETKKEYNGIWKMEAALEEAKKLSGNIGTQEILSQDIIRLKNTMDSFLAELRDIYPLLQKLESESSSEIRLEKEDFQSINRLLAELTLIIESMTSLKGSMDPGNIIKRIKERAAAILMSDYRARLEKMDYALQSELARMISDENPIYQKLISFGNSLRILKGETAALAEKLNKIPSK